MRFEVSDKQMFANLIEEARILRILRKRGGSLVCTHPDGKREKIILKHED